MGDFSLVSETDLLRARTDPEFRQRLLGRNLEALLSSIKKLRGASTQLHGSDAKKLREGVELAVRLSELIQNVDDARRTHLSDLLPFPRGRV